MDEKNDDNVIGLYEIVRDRYGKKHAKDAAQHTANIRI